MVNILKRNYDLLAKNLLVFSAIFLISGGVFFGVSFAESSENKIPSPKEQMRQGVNASDVICDYGLSLVLKFSTNTSACVKSQSASKLNERGWGLLLKNSDEMENQRKQFEINKITDETKEDSAQTIGEQVSTEPQIEVIYNPKINHDDFVSTINNPFFTLIPGTTFVFESQTEDGLERIETTVTEDKREVMGIKTTVVWDREWLDEELVEDTKDWYAQDKEGNVWYFGEFSQGYENGQLLGTSGSWEAGIDGAKPGIIMKASPKVGDNYRQEYYEGIAEDMGEVMDLGVSIKTDFAYFSNCLKTKEWTPLESDSIEFKYYCLKTNNLVMEEKVSDGETVIIVDVGGEKLITDITPEQAKEIALNEVSGVVTDIIREGFRGKVAYAVEIKSENGQEIDVFVDIKTGKVLGTET